MTSPRPAVSLPAGETRTGFVIAATVGVAAQCGLFRHGAAGAAAIALHAAVAGLAYLLFLNLSTRKLGAPLIAAVLLAAHPAAATALASPGGWTGSAGAALALLSGVLLARTPISPRYLAPSLASYAASLPLSPGTAPVPLLVAAGVVAYHGLEPAKLLGRRLLPRFAGFVALLAAWSAISALRGPVPDLALAARHAAAIVAPFTQPVDGSAAAGAATVVLLGAFGLLRLRRSPKAAWPLLGAASSFLAAACLRDAWGGAGSAVAPLAFLALAAAEGLEEIHFRFGGAAAVPLFLLIDAAFAVLSHLVAAG